MRRKEVSKAEAFNKKGIENSMQLHRWFPIRYIDNHQETGIVPQYVDAHVSVVAFLDSYKRKEYTNGKRGFYLVCKLRDRLTNTKFNVTIFNGYSYLPFIERNIYKPIFCSGILEYDNRYGYSLKLDSASGEYMITDDFNFFYNRITPVFTKVAGIDPKEVRNIMGANLLYKKEVDTLPENIKEEMGLPDINEALWNMNYPESREALDIANKRLLVDDLFYMASRFTLQSRNYSDEGIKIEKTDFTDGIIKNLPYFLTEDQRKTFEKIKKKMLTGEKVTALVQGDVSCGKTITAILSAFLAVENGFQSVIMAPTKILAAQHYEEICRYLEGTGYEAVLLAGNYLTKKTVTEIKEGKINIIVGTSQVLSKAIEYNNIGMFIVDEEHKFGVEQREQITKASKNINYIAMSATPIPRTLAKSLYSSNTDIFEIHSMPGGRLPVKTFQADDRLKHNGICYALNNGNQVYVICPAIDNDLTDEEDTSDILSTKAALERYRAEFPGAIIEELNGKMSKKDADDVINRFKSGEINILISTTIVEVGVNVPNATLIVIENAERFGLAQMHQLRGRVGRGKVQSYCALVSKDKENRRIQTLCSTNDGFEIAMADLTQLRKSGDLFGNNQSGFNRYVEESFYYKEIYDYLVKKAEALPDNILQQHIDKMSEADTKKMKFFFVKEYSEDKTTNLMPA